ncbi:hypothetical protein C8N46_10347 [Kordia periserrulae]|uniref:DUF5683 domain-containing protein n=1 Tax=Kordia periserrulae TaxID=701523 RepID=A0A2T6C0V3_9FLAO|nr:DUF5683 domain-containing protein [Kordia periserrulae]PTX61950.1 hypothetical protein C8N46_10347 [Kordia periserrulae]
MGNKIIIALCCIVFACQFSWAQEKNEETKETTKEEKTTDETKKDESALKIKSDLVLDEKKDIDPLSPSKAAFYSAILPGLGQAYNKKYWKIPIVYAALGTGIYFYIDNNRNYNRYRRAYKRRLAGFTDDEFQNIVVDNNALIDAQEFYQRNRDLSLLLTVVAYVLNIVDANVDAHLLQFNVSDDLSVRPHIDQNDVDFNRNLGLTLNFRF